MPFFEKHYLDMVDEGAAPSKEKPHKKISAQDVGVAETQAMLSRHNRFLLRYTDQFARARHAVWLMGLAACSADNDFTHQALAQCVQQGLEIPSIVRLGIDANSLECARFLNANGVDWRTQLVAPSEPEYRSSRLDAHSPHSALLEYAVNPKGVSAHFGFEQPQVSVFQGMDGHEQPDNFFRGMLESGQLDPGLRTPSAALGLRDGQATILSQFIANGQLKLAAKFIQHAKTLPQQVLDEALLACAMLSGSTMMEDHRKALSPLAKHLHARGANPDAIFSFGMSAWQELTGRECHSYFHDTKAPRKASTREWAIKAGLVNTPTSDLEKAFFPEPWPSAPEGFSSWVETALKRHGGEIRRRAEMRPARFMINRLLRLPSAPDLAQLIEQVGVDTLGPLATQEWDVVDVLLDSKQSRGALGKMDYATVMSLVCAWGGLDKHADADLSRTLLCMEQRSKEWWNHPRLQKALLWLGEEDLAVARGKIEPFAAQARKFLKSQAHSAPDREAMALAYTSFLQSAPNAQSLPRPKRRTL